MDVRTLGRAARAGLLAALLAVGAWPARAEVPVPPLRARVTDLAGVLPAGERANLEATLRAFEERKGSQVAVLVLPTTQLETIEQFGIRVAEAWKLGRKGVDDGAILLVAVQDRALRIEVGYGLEGALPDAITKRIISEVIVPRFRQGDLPGGIRAGVSAILQVIESEPLPPPKSAGAGARVAVHNGGFPQMLLFGIFLLFALGWLLRALFGRLGGALIGAGGAGVLAWLLSGLLLLGIVAAIVAFAIVLAGGLGGAGLRHSGQRWGGGWGGLGGGGFGGGGFGGGGGGFGGGGASGRW
jgi:uncharacterized protein